MDKEEILQKSRRENKNGDERERSVRQKKSAVAAIAGLLACLFFTAIEMFVFDRSPGDLMCVCVIISAVEEIVEYRESRKHFDLVMSVLGVLMVGIILALYLIEGFGN